ncbi:amidohydrolase [Thalassobacillus devorans]|uniref:amidohydrolase n=1 Tax=Thalassobacillus devorans TaxID=279813 RepID=UPI00048FB193|nr:amidohydrolase [Thalassobacillus devorans]
MAGNNQMLYYNAKIFTSNPEQLYADAMIIKDGRVHWIGEYVELGGEPENKVNLQGRRVLPGFIDAHLHPMHLAKISNQVPSTPPTVHSIQDLVEQVRLRAEEQNEDKWIEGWGFDEGKLIEGRTPTRWDLDKAAPDAPVFLTRTCGHIAVANSKALRLAGIDKHTSDPEGGEIDRDDMGEPTGILRENAKDLFEKAMPTQTLEEKATMLAEHSSELLRYGVTGMTDMMARKGETDDYDIYTEARKKGLKQRTALYYKWEDIEHAPILDKNRTEREEPVHIGGFKLFSDGSVSGRTAWVKEPFIGDDSNYGIKVTTKKELLAAAEGAKANGIQLAIHAMGEQAIEWIVDTLKHIPGWLEDAPSIRIEHVSFPSEQVLKRAVEAGIGFVTQPIFLYAEIESYKNNIGLEKTQHSYPIKSMLQTGGAVAFSSDAPGNAWSEPVDPFVGLKAAVTRLAHDGTDVGKDQQVDLPTAIILYTKAAQELTRIADTGQLKRGFHADFMVLDQDIFTMEAEDIDKASVLETYIDGNLFFQKEKLLSQ